MTWDEITLESPSFNASNAGTMLRLPSSRWRRVTRDASPPEAATGNDQAPLKSDAGAYLQVIVVEGQITQKNAIDTDVWNPTIIEGTSRTALLSSEHFVDLLEKARTAWWKEAASGNWHDDGTPARAKGLCRMRIGYKETGAYPTSTLAAKYVYGYVPQVTIGDVLPGHKDARIYPFRVEFAYANVQSTG